MSRGVGSWFRAFTTILVERPRLPQPVAPPAGPWRIIAVPGDRLAEQLSGALSMCPRRPRRVDLSA